MMSVLLVGAVGGALVGWGLREIAAAFFPCLDCNHHQPTPRRRHTRTRIAPWTNREAA